MKPTIQLEPFKTRHLGEEGAPWGESDNHSLDDLCEIASGPGVKEKGGAMVNDLLGTPLQPNSTAPT